MRMLSHCVCSTYQYAAHATPNPRHVSTPVANTSATRRGALVGRDDWGVRFRVEAGAVSTAQEGAGPRV